jgi:aminoglycoside phosphotransferase family enzyme/predicted kinase
MNIAVLVDVLAEPAAYPFPVDMVEVHHTHISVVFLAGAFAYKIKKPVQLGFVDFSTLEKRRHFCHEEVRLNRRLAPNVYLSVVPIAHDDAGVRLEGKGEIIEWAVKMERLPRAAGLKERLGKGEAGAGIVADLASRLASFHQQAEANARISEAGRFEVIAQNARDNFAQSRSHIGVTVSPSVHERVQQLTEERLDRLRPLMERRALEGKPRDTHGDLRLEHVYFFPDQPPPGDLVIIDCIEFNERLRHADPIADMAFLVMYLVYHGQQSLAMVFAQTYFQASADEEGRSLMPFYVAYRAAVRAKVLGMENEESEVPVEERLQVCNKARGHWLLALGELEAPSTRPVLVMIGGLPGTGKSTLAHALAKHTHLEVIRSDVVRKEILPAPGPAAAGFQEGIYSPEMTRRTYEECLRRAEAFFFQGRRVLVDATFREDLQRRIFLEAAGCWAVPAAFLVCQAEPDLARRRLAERRGDASDAEWAIYSRMATHWEPPGAGVVPTYLAASANRDQVLTQALAVLTSYGMY